MSLLKRSKSLPIINTMYSEATMYTPLVSEDSRKFSLVFKNHSPETKRVNKQLCFLVNKEGSREWWSIDEFLDGEEFTEEHVCEWVNKKNGTATKFPNVRRRCLMCNCYATKGTTICGRNEHKHGGKNIQAYIYG